MEDGVNGYLFEPNNARFGQEAGAVLSLPAAEREQMDRESHIVGFHSAENAWRTFELYVRDAPVPALPGLV